MTRDSGSDVLRGTLDLLILRTLRQGSLHGWGIAQRIEEVSQEALQIGQGAVYPGLQRLEEKGWLEGEWAVTPDNRRARYYRLTKSGKRALAEEQDKWRRYVAAVDLVLNMA